MAIFPIRSRAELKTLKKAVTHNEQIWQKEISKFTCPHHLRKATAHVTDRNGKHSEISTPMYIEACCADFASFCIEAVELLLNPKKPLR
jgi:hypothetical protein